MFLVLDSTVVSGLCTPHDKAAHEELARWFADLLRRAADRVTVVLPEIVDYEVRRGLLHLALKESRDPARATSNLDRLGEFCQYLPLDTSAMRNSARLWAEARARGRPTAHPERLDADPILAAQAQSVSGTIVTDNLRHLEQFGPAKRWQDIDPEALG